MSITFLTNEDEKRFVKSVNGMTPDENGNVAIQASAGEPKDGITPHIGDNGNWFIGDTDTGMPSRGETGPQGPAYVLTDADRAAIVADVVASLGGNPVFGYVDENNNIIVSGNLADGTYTVKYEMEDGGTMDIGQLVLAEDEPDEPVQTYTNQIPLAIDASDNPFNGGQGWKTGYRLSASGGSETAADGYECTGFIPAKIGDVLRVKNIDLTAENATNIVFYDGSKTPIACNGTNKGTTLTLFFSTSEGDGVSSGTIGNSANLTFSTDVAFIRIGSQSITADSILTINEPIV